MEPGNLSKLLYVCRCTNTTFRKMPLYSRSQSEIIESIEAAAEKIVLVDEAD